ncbi:MAG: hypothetical protein GMKNLPBB_02514 [Myxococcota bacterium]|nr:hypothetical protein [Myxococcota bacterium]
MRLIRSALVLALICLPLASAWAQDGDAKDSGTRKEEKSPAGTLGDDVEDSGARRGRRKPKASARAADAEAESAAPAASTAAPGKDIGHSSLNGSTGVVRVISADNGRPWTLRFAIRGEAFGFSDFLKANDSNTYFGSNVSLSLTTVEYLQVYTNIATSANNNSQGNPKLLLNLSDFFFGVKGSYPVHKAFKVGGDIGLDFNAKPGDNSVSLGSTGVLARAVGTMDIRGLGVNFPMLAHLNLGGYFIGGGAYDNVNFDDIEQFALGIQEQGYFNFGLAFEFPFAYARPYLEVLWNEPNARTNITPGVRVTPFSNKGIAFDVAAEIGLRRLIVDNVPAPPPYNIVFGFTYAADLTGSGGGAGELPPSGMMMGSAIDSESGEPLGGVVIAIGEGVATIASDPTTGKFQSSFLPPGEYKVTASRDGYQPVEDKITISESKPASIKLSLRAKAGRETGRITGRVVGLDGAGSPASVKIEGPSSQDLKTDPKTGEFQVDVPAGNYKVTVTPDGGKPVEHNVAVEKAGVAVVDLVNGVTQAAGPAAKMTDGPARLTWGKIELAEPLEFNDADALDASKAKALESVARLIKDNPTIERVIIESHTDNSAAPDVMLERSKKRADAVKAELVRLGVPAEKLDARGMGDSQPVASNRTTGGRARNNRIELFVSTAGQ